MLEEKRNMLRLLAGRKITNNLDPDISLNGKRIDEIDAHINRLKILLIKLSHNRDDTRSA